ncbi:hypothetical protein D9M72_312270 [compost metagenome]
MDRVPAEQAGTLGEVVVRAAADHDGPEPEAVAAAGLFNEEAREQAADAAEAIEHDVGAGAVVAAALPDDVGEFGAQEFIQACTVGLGLELLVQAGNIDCRSTQVQPGEGIQQRGRLFQEQLVLAHPSRKAVRLQDVHGGFVDQAAAVDGGHHVVLAVQPADDRDHGLG